jgi:tryptophan 2,3-dioxygenase
MRPRQRLKIHDTPYKARFKDEDRAVLKDSEAVPSLFDLINRWLGRTPFLHFGDFEFWDEYRRAVDAMLAHDKRSIEDNPTLLPEKKEAQLAALEATKAQFDALFEADKYQHLLEDGTFKMSHEALQAALLINLYRDEPILQLPFRLLAALMDIDEHFTKWRYRHALMVLRMIGRKIGTGGSTGHDYLRQTAEEHKVFSDLFQLSTFYIPRSALPELPESVRQAMGFRYSAG